MERYPARDLLKVNEPVRRALAARYPRILVDEFQDTDPLQAEIIWRLAGEGDVALPWHDASLPAARLYVAETCGPCAELRRWFERQGARGLVLIAAEDHPTRDLERMTYDPGDGPPTKEGAAAFARAVEHIHFGWAFVGATMRLPIIRHAVQLLADATGLGPRAIPRRIVPSSSCLQEARADK